MDDLTILNEIHKGARMGMDFLEQISKILIQGNDMGIVKAVKLLNQNPQASQETKDILNGFIRLQENNIERLKKFL